MNDQNLESLLEEHSQIMAERMLSAVDWARSEEDIRHECNKLIDEFVRKAGLNVRGWHEYGLAGGRIDSKYGGVVIEYKEPHGSGRIAQERDAPGVRAVVAQIQKRFEDLQQLENVAMERTFGVGCDGKSFVFMRYRGGKFEIDDPQPVTPQTVERLLRAVVSLGATGLSFTPDNLAAYFGSESKAAQDGVRLIHDVMRDTESSKAETFFRQWQILFGEVCGYEIHGQNTKTAKLAGHYAVSDPSPAQLLFAVHTYYAIFIKLLAAEIVASFSPLGTSTLKKLVAAPTSSKLRYELLNLEQGGIWTQLGIRNFLEGDLFSWYLDAWDERCADAVRAMVQALDQFDPSTLSVDPGESRDLLKHLYQQLFPRAVRHDLGEYYTPDWLADLVLDELGYDGNPDKRLLDPACGSGTFLVMALNRAKNWFGEHRLECGFGEDGLLRRVLSNIIGFDLNPLAVMAARTNYLMAIRDLLRYADNVELPVYLCDSIMTPSEYGDLFTGGHGRVHKLKTSAGDFIVPNEIAENRDRIGRYADTLEFCVRNRYSPDEFVERCRAEGIPTTEDALHKELYNRLLQLDLDNKNGVWARIIKNAFAPLFVGRVDYVAGNPPWVNWENLPDEYRQSTAPLWQEYDLFRHKGYRAKLGAGKDDVSILMTYVAHDAYLRDGGRLGFVITQSVFKTVGGGEGFRTLQYTKLGRTYYLSPICVHDLSNLQPFEGATNRTAVLVVKKTEEPFQYPVPYVLWQRRAREQISTHMSLARVLENTSRRDLGAQPVQKNQLTSPWLTAPKDALPGIQKALGKSDYQAHAGCCTWLNGVFWVRVVESLPGGHLLIENMQDVGKLKQPFVQAAVESELVYPLLRGRDVGRWCAKSSAHIILPNETDRLAGIPESTMKQQYPKTYAYLKRFEGSADKPQAGTLRGRSGYRQYFKPTDPFYSVYNVGPYTMSDWKVIWREQSSQFQAAAVHGTGKALCIPDHKLMLVPCHSGEEAYFLAGVLNSSPSVLIVCCHVISTSTSTHLLESIAAPKFDPKNELHWKIAALAETCHSKACSTGGDAEAVAEVEREIDQAVAELWGITDFELGAIQRGLREMMGIAEAAQDVDRTGEDSDEE